MLKWLLIIFGVVVGLILLITLVGLLLPKRHTATRTARFNQPPETIWQTITDHANEPSWRGDIKKKERLEDRNGHPVWRETRKGGDIMTLETITFEPPRKMVGRIADENLPFGGTWTYDIKPIERGNACMLTITEDGEIYNPIFRFVARFIIGYRGTMVGYLTALSKKFGAEPVFVD